jgi:hypothetical protein
VAIAALGLTACEAAAYLILCQQLAQGIDESGIYSPGVRATTFTGIGFGFALIGVVITAIGAVFELIGFGHLPPRSDDAPSPDQP